MSRAEDPFSRLRNDYVRAGRMLFAAVADACPGRHQMVQHSDGRPPWCTACRRTVDGRPVTAIRGQRLPKADGERDESNRERDTG
jgi:hypothetical protein